MLSDGCNYNNQLRIMSEFSLQMRLKCPYLFPFSTSCQKSDQSQWNPQALSDLGSMVDELVGTELENKQAPNEGGDIEVNIVVVDHVEKSVIACGAQRERGEAWWGEDVQETASKLGVPQTI